ncbi:hypothetical protein [Streptomyces sp. NPDC005336]|uniref:hypothetical protein n=1 Tax=Streptomyces sp. NPDC005336 TaxID=3157035 RepID=UPI0033B8B579
MIGHSEPKSYPLSCEQEAIWLNDAMAEGRSRYTVLWARRLRGDVDPDAVEWALDQVTLRHESLRSRPVRGLPAVPACSMRRSS